MTKIENRGKAAGISLRAVVTGAISGILITVLLLLVGAALIAGEKAPESISGLIASAAILSGSFIGGLFAGRCNRGAYALSGLAVGIVLFCIRMIVAAFCDNGSLFGGKVVSLLLFMLGGGFFGGLMAGKKRHGRKK